MPGFHSTRSSTSFRPGKRATTEPSAIWPSSRASDAPRQKCAPKPNDRWRLSPRARSSAIGVGEHLGVAVGRGEDQRELVLASRSRQPSSSTSRDRRAREVSATGPSKRSSSSTAVPQQLRPRAQPRELGGVTQERVEAVADQVRGRLVAGGEDQHDGAEQLVVAEPVLDLARGDQPADQVVARASRGARRRRGPCTRASRRRRRAASGSPLLADRAVEERDRACPTSA